MTALAGWGRTAPSVAVVRAAGEDDQLAEAVAGAPVRGVIARGLGRSYGDPAQNGGGAVLDMTSRSRVLSVDVPSGRVLVEAGASLDHLMQHLLPLGLMVPVSPGTRQVTVGGAVAADIHGKNHHAAGSFCDHVESLDLLTADGVVRSVSRESDPQLFWATAGGMGLTGLVLRVLLRMSHVESAHYVVDTERARDLDDLMARLEADDHRYPHSVAWIDCLARGSALGRSVITRGRSARVAELPRSLQRAPLVFRPSTRLTVPDVCPPRLLNGLTVRAFNELWFRKAPRRVRRDVQGLGQFFHPLDAVEDWNRIYGPRGFLQYQFVVPFGEEQALRDVVRRLSDAGTASFLAVLKRFGTGNPGPLSFPAPGWTLALDIPVGGGLGELLDDLDRSVLDAGGRLYLAKDSRATARTVHAMYPRVAEFRAVRDRVDPHRHFRSDLARRLDL
ncbi:decaprenylphospho-beta-D-ribofuranose 2-oxidase [Geodermatophilus dictyosporus]|uniref:Decaprenylphospho-beta-D-ribofuranose 2-oxidase n=1 Tax=Geodermatophilus dictyosporus TaxID=1523247 RepID=A0A1I5LZS7_9ACTN|nr:FAD-binding oxidoreductase [Geodermatophilus dictyosporus]SFP02266.1 decaprenylphospho-beta-D-ribofuranose 2-oxidase [Geodermatophilus dictyosporus]